MALLSCTRVFLVFAYIGQLVQSSPAGAAQLSSGQPRPTCQSLTGSLIGSLGGQGGWLVGCLAGRLAGHSVWAESFSVFSSFFFFLFFSFSFFFFYLFFFFLTFLCGMLINLWKSCWSSLHQFRRISLLIPY